MTVFKTRRVVKSEIGAAFIKVSGAIKWRKNLNQNLLTLLLLHAQCSMKGKNIALSEQQGRNHTISPLTATSPINFNGQ